MTEWLKVIDCKSVDLFLHRFESYFLHFSTIKTASRIRSALLSTKKPLDTENWETWLWDCSLMVKQSFLMRFIKGSNPFCPYFFV